MTHIAKVKKKMPDCPWCKENASRHGDGVLACARHPNGQDAPRAEPHQSPFAWASIAGANPEPVEISEVEGRPCLYTIGCEDAFFLDDPTVLLYVDELDRPDNLMTQDQVEEEERKWRSAKRSHGWRGPR